MIKLNYPNFWEKRTIVSYALYPLSFIYRFLGFIRRLFTKQEKFCAPVICVGNATVGGTGKTPLIKALAMHYARKKKNLLIICKGYGGNFVKPTIIEADFSICLAGDEAIEIAKELSNFSDVTIVIAKNPKACVRLVSQIKPDLILIDDGMQNPGFYKDFSILAIDGLRGFGNGFLVPAGPLREASKEAIRRSDIVVSADPSMEVKGELKKLAENKCYFIKQSVEMGSLTKDEPVFLLCAIGNPNKFFVSMKDYNIVGKMSFPDHHNYTNEDMSKVTEEALKACAVKIITTKKDFVKLQHHKTPIEIKAANLILDEKDLQKIIKKIDEKIN